MKTKEQIVTEIAEDKLIETIARNIGGLDDDLDDLCQDLYISLLSKPEELLVSMFESKQLQFYLTKMVLNNIRSKNSPYYTTYKKDKTRKLSITDNDIPDVEN